MDAHALPTHVTRACSAHMHGCCSGIDGDGVCGCGCHQLCARCLSECQATYDATQDVGIPFLVCAPCYTELTRDRVQQRCEGCGGSTAYRDSALGEEYLCLNCHQLRQQQRAEATVLIRKEE